MFLHDAPQNYQTYTILILDLNNSIMFIAKDSNAEATRSTNYRNAGHGGSGSSGPGGPPS